MFILKIGQERRRILWTDDISLPGLGECAFGQIPELSLVETLKGHGCTHSHPWPFDWERLGRCRLFVLARQPSLWGILS
jgi:hypothetical protein